MSLMSGYGAHHNPATFGAQLQKQLNAIAASDPNRLGVIPRANGGPIGMGRTATEWDNLYRRADANQRARYDQVVLAGGQGQTTGGGGGGGSGGGGGGGGGRMGPQDQRKIMNVGPRTSAEYTAKHGGLSPQRPSTLDAAYAQGNLTNPNPAAPAAPAATPMEQGGGYNLNLNQFDKPNEPTQLAMRAKGGPMKMGSKPYLVGEEGPELIMPRDNGDAYVLPHDVTKQILPMMTNAPTPRAQGGVMESRGGTFRGFEGTSSSGQPATGFASNIPTAMMTPDAIARAQGERVFVDPVQGRYQLDPTQPGMPIMPDTVAGPWAEPGMPAPPRAQMRQDIGASVQSLMRMPGARAAQTGQYPGETFDDERYFQLLENNYNDPKFKAEEAAGNYGTTNKMRDAAYGNEFEGQKVNNLSFEELRDRVAMRGSQYGADFLDTQARNQTQLDLAARANRAPLGTPTAPATQIPGLPAMRPSAAAEIQRQQERFLRTPEGAQFALANQQQSQLLSQRADLAARAIPVTDPATGQVMGYTNGLGASLPNPNRATRTVNRQQQIEGQWYNFFDDGSAEPINVAGATKATPLIAWDGTKTVELPAGTDTAALPPGLTLLPQTATAPGAAKPAPAPTSTARPITSKAEYEALAPGTPYMWNGQTLTKKA